MDHYEQDARRFKAFSDPIRLRILALLLRGGETCSCVLQESLPIGQSTLSHHMKILCDAGILIGRKDGKWVRYSFSEEGIETAFRLLGAYTHRTDEGGNAMALNFLKKRNLSPDSSPANPHAPLLILGTGCDACDALKAETRKAVAQLGLDWEIAHITDLAEIVSYGVMTAPALVIHGKVVAAGRYLKAADVVALIEKEQADGRG